jgi:hypothetical protein
MAFYMTISFASWLSSLLPLGLAFRAKMSSVVRKIAWLCALSFLFDLVSYLLGSRGINTYPVGNAFLLVQALIFMAIYRDALKMRSIYYFPLTAAYTVFFIVNYLFIQRSLVVNSYSVVAGAIGFVILSLIYFRHLLTALPEDFVHRIPMVWVNIAVLIYFGGNLFLFGLYDYFVSGEWILHNFLNLTKNLLLFVAVWQSQRKINSTSS